MEDSKCKTYFFVNIWSFVSIWFFKCWNISTNSLHYQFYYPRFYVPRRRFEIIFVSRNHLTRASTPPTWRRCLQVLDDWELLGDIETPLRFHERFGIIYDDSVIVLVGRIGRTFSLTLVRVQTYKTLTKAKANFVSLMIVKRGKSFNIINMF